MYELVLEEKETEETLVVEVEASFDLLKELDRQGFARYYGGRGFVPEDSNLNRTLGKRVCETILDRADGGERQWGKLELRIPASKYKEYCDVIHGDPSRQRDRVRDVIKDSLINGIGKKEVRRDFSWLWTGAVSR